MGTERQTAIETKTRILLVDDDQIVLDSLGGFLELDGYDVMCASAIPQAIDCLRSGRFNLVITDVNMPESDGFELLRYVRAHHAELVVILITGYGTIESAIEAIKQGAYDYLTKPIIDDDVRMAVQRALHQQELLAENRQLKRALGDRYSFENIVGQDYRMGRVFDLIEAVADSPSTVLITGESGTGKSLIARAIHAHSRRRHQPFVEVACGALPDTLLESELFGHLLGSFTGAVADKPGKFAAADGGTIFLDEVSTASPQLQVKLLRVLQERRFEPVGSTETSEVDVRVILATNLDLQEQVDQGNFRTDLYYRINVVNIELPALRERVGDIPLLATHFLNRFREAADKEILGFKPEVTERMQQYGWPGNVRELENSVERAVVLSRGPYIGASDLPPAVLKGSSACAGGYIPAGDAATSDHGADGPMTLTEALTAPEKRIIQAALEANRQNRQKTAAQLGINRTTLYKKMKKYGLMS